MKWHSFLLRRQFKLSKLAVINAGQPMKIFQHRACSDESLTLGANAEGTMLCARYMSCL
jgi:hypothetical protein